MLAAAQLASASSTPTSPSFSSASRSSDQAVAGDYGLDPPSGISFHVFLQSWNDTQVSRWLHEYRCGVHSTLFASNDIRGDLLLELDNITLKEMGVSSVGDRVRILSAVKQLRQRCHRPRSTASLLDASHVLDTVDMNVAGEASAAHKTRRLENGRPPPLHLSYNTRSELPRVDRQGHAAVSTPDAQKSVMTPRANSQGSSSTNGHHRHHNLPPLPPPPRSQPPAPPASTSVTSAPSRVRPLAIPSAQSRLANSRTPTQLDVATPVSGAWSGDYGLPVRPNPGNVGGKPTTPRATSPLPQTPLNLAKRPGNASAPGNSSSTSSPPRQSMHDRSHSLPGSSGRSGAHPYASGQALQPPQVTAIQLSPIAESFNPNTPVSSSNSSGHDYRVGRGPFTPGGRQGPSHRSIDDIRRKTIKFHLPEEGATRTVDVADSESGVQVLQRVLKKFGKLGSGEHETDQFDLDDSSGLTVDGWSVFWSSAVEDGAGRALSEAELLSVCHSELDHPVREHGLILRRVVGGKQKRSKQLANIFGEQPPLNRTSPTSPKELPAAPEDDGYLKSDDLAARKTKRASTISILSGLGVKDPAIDSSPVVESTALRSADRTSKPSRIRNFFGQRPPSEVITTHLQDFFPFTEKRVLERTARHSMMRQRRESNRDSMMLSISRNSWNRNRESQLSQSRFSTSSMGSGGRSSLSDNRFSASSPALPLAKADETDPALRAPRVEVSSEDGRRTEIRPGEDPQSETASVASSNRSGNKPTHLLPPVNFGNEAFSDSFELVPNMASASQRFNHLSELRSKRDNSDAASMLTVDEITAEVESRRASVLQSTEAALEGALRKRNSVAFPRPNDNQLQDQQVPQEDVMMDEVQSDGGDELAEEDEEFDEEDEEEDEDGELELVSVEEEDDAPKAVTSTGARAIKWIKGALIGRGSFGSVYLAMDAQRGLLMAVKQVELPTGSSANEERKKSMLSALEREIELLKDLQHENIVQYLDSSMDSEYLNIFLEYVPGGSVTALLRNYGAFEEPLVRNFVRQILQGLNYLHSRDIIHRDIKGANILVDNKSCVKISDFGISKRVEDSLLSQAKAHRPSLQGSVFWMAPEVVKQTTYTPKADIWSLGCLCVEMLTAEHPWGKLNQMQALFKIGSSAKPVVPSDISTEADDFMQKSFNLDHMLRPSAAELLKHVWIANDPSFLLPPTVKAPLAPPPTVLVTS